MYLIVHCWVLKYRYACIMMVFPVYLLIFHYIERRERTSKSLMG